MTEAHGERTEAEKEESHKSMQGKGIGRREGRDIQATEKLRSGRYIQRLFHVHVKFLFHPKKCIGSSSMSIIEGRKVGSPAGRDRRGIHAQGGVHVGIEQTCTEYIYSRQNERQAGRQGIAHKVGVLGPSSSSSSL